MDVAELVLKYVEAVIWPLVTLTVAWYLRAYLREAFARMTRIETPAGAIEFEAEARQLRERAEELADAPPAVPYGRDTQPWTVPAPWQQQPPLPHDPDPAPAQAPAPWQQPPPQPQAPEPEPAAAQTPVPAPEPPSPGPPSPGPPSTGPSTPEPAPVPAPGPPSPGPPPTPEPAPRPKPRPKPRPEPESDPRVEPSREEMRDAEVEDEPGLPPLPPQFQQPAPATGTAFGYGQPPEPTRAAAGQLAAAFSAAWEILDSSPVGALAAAWSTLTERLDDILPPLPQPPSGREPAVLRRRLAVAGAPPDTLAVFDGLHRLREAAVLERIPVTARAARHYLVGCERLIEELSATH
ncbi:hypothetical protein ACQEU8_26385 [Streptomyces sp. CA-250714]|uniref:hypothetical protein n=1 Tax=Streptomyces sp. CA-250714 TaxID=3240060 RepID=UPI003D94105C